MAKHYDEATCIRSLSKKGARIDYGTHYIEVPKNSPLFGNGTNGKLDYLEHYCGWRVIRVLQSQIAANKIQEKQIKHKRKKNNNVLDMEFAEDINKFAKTIKMK